MVCSISKRRRNSEKTKKNKKTNRIERNKFSLDRCDASSLFRTHALPEQRPQYTLLALDCSIVASFRRRVFITPPYEMDTDALPFLQLTNLLWRTLNSSGIGPILRKINVTRSICGATQQTRVYEAVHTCTTYSTRCHWQLLHFSHIRRPNEKPTYGGNFTLDKLAKKKNQTKKRILLIS